MRSEYTSKDWNKFEENYSELTKKDNTLYEQNGNKDYLWDTYEMSTKIKNNMILTNGDHDFHLALNPCTYMARKFKFVKNENIKNLLYRFYRYDECNYNAELFGTKIIDLCNKYGCSYIFTIYWELCKNDKDFENFYFVPITHLYRQSSKMNWARINENGNLYYTEPTHTKNTVEEMDKFLEELKKIRKEKND